MADPTYINKQGSNITKGQACYIFTDGNVKLATSTQEVMAIVKDAIIANDASGNFHPAGVITCDAWAFSGAGLPVYIDDATAGQLTTTAPTTSKDPQCVAMTMSATSIWWPGPDLSHRTKTLTGFQVNSAAIANQSNVNFIAGTGMNISGANDASYNRVNVTLTSSAPAGDWSVAGIYDVKNKYGAVGDGVSDDTDNIQNALNAAGNAGGGTVWFPPGTYKVTSWMTIPNYVTLAGVRWKSIIKNTVPYSAQIFLKSGQISSSR